MSIAAINFAWHADLEPVQKLIFLAYTDFITEDNTAWVTGGTLAKRIFRVSPSTIKRHTVKLIENGWLREGDQAAQDTLPEKWKNRPLRARPIVYDIPRDEETRLKWQAEYTPGPRRAAAVAAGEVGGQRSAAKRRAGHSPDAGLPDESPQTGTGGVNLQPTPDCGSGPDVTGNSQAGEGVNLQPPAAANVAASADLQPPGVAPGARGGGCTAVQPNLSLKKHFKEHKTDPTTSNQSSGDGEPEIGGHIKQPDLGLVGPDGTIAPKKPAAKKPAQQRAVRLPAEFAVTPAMVEWARDRCPHVDGRLETEKFVNYWTAKGGQDARKVDWPATWRNWMIISEERAERPAAGRPAPGNVWHDPAMPQTEHDRMANLFEGVSVDGKRIQ